MRIIEVVTDTGHTDTLHGIAEQHAALDVWTAVCSDEQRATTHMLVLSMTIV